MWWRVLVGTGIALALMWAVLVLFLVVIKPRGFALKEAARLMPDTVRLLRRLAVDRSLPGDIRLRLWLLFVYLAMPIDLIPDFLPVIGYADDAIIVAAVLRSVVRRAGFATVQQHWPGTPDGLAALVHATRLPTDGSASV